MKFKGTLTVALTSLAIFFALAVAGGICFAAGINEYAQNSDVIGNVGDLLSYVGQYTDDFNVNVGSGSRTSESYTRELDTAVVDTVVVDASGCSVSIVPASDGFINVDFSGLAAADAKTAFGSSPAPSGEGIAHDSAYYSSDGIIRTSLVGSELRIDVAAAGVTTFFGISNNGIGEIRISLPADFNGSLEINNSVDDMQFRGFVLENLILKNSAGEVNVDNCTIGMLTVKNLAGEVDASGIITGVDFSNIAGEIVVETAKAFDRDCTISDIAGEVEIDLPYGTALRITRNSILGYVDIDDIAAGTDSDPLVAISGVMGEVAIGIDN